jgi:hypothetical protein
MAYPCAYADSSATGGLTLRKETWFSAAMTQRSIQHSHNIPARRAARSAAIAQAERTPDHFILNVALAALVIVVVVLITPFTGAG